MGHTKGDDVLRDVAKTLRHQFRKDDIIARLGGDEFVILLKNLDSDAVIERLAASLNRALCRTYTQDNISLSISALHRHRAGADRRHDLCRALSQG